LFSAAEAKHKFTVNLEFASTTQCSRIVIGEPSLMPELAAIERRSAQWVGKWHPGSPQQ
jgi:hypothetical protein